MEVKKSARTIHGNKYLQSALVEAAWGATRKKDGYLKRKYQSLIARRGKKKALVAVGHKIIIASYFIIRDQVAYQEPKLKTNPKKKIQKANKLLSQLKELGMEVRDAYFVE